MGDPHSQEILHSIRGSSKDAQSISEETRIPLSSIYRKLSILREAGLVFVKAFEITSVGKRQDKYMAAVSEVHVKTSGEVLEIELIPNDEGANRIWFRLFNG